MEESIKCLEEKIIAARQREQEIIQEINRLGEADHNPQRGNETAKKIRQLDAERRACVRERSQYQAAKSQICGCMSMLARRDRLTGTTARVALQEALAMAQEKVKNETHQ